MCIPEIAILVEGIRIRYPTDNFAISYFDKLWMCLFWTLWHGFEINCIVPYFHSQSISALLRPLWCTISHRTDNFNQSCFRVPEYFD